ncbi:MAG: type II toxin-antitoxin system RelE/ParE family toxin [Alphaproteobacteria bacterium]|nr:type II toxin-antitoxin system RelE/ParE family toxin [Alphaproteobacteria bacterium]
MTRRVFRCYLGTGGKDVIDGWYEAQEERLQAKFDTRMRFLRQQPRASWVRPYFDTLGGACAGLGEMRFEYKNVQYRVIGFASGEMEYTWLFVALEKGGKFVPRDTCTMAQQRKAEVMADRGRAHGCEFD